MATVTGTLRDFGLDPLTKNPQLYFHPVAPGITNGSLLAPKPIKASMSGTESFSVDLADQTLTLGANQYRIEAVWLDENLNVADRAWWPGTLTVTAGGGQIGKLIELPTQNGMIWVPDGQVDTSRVDQYQFVDGWLYERTA